MIKLIPDMPPNVVAFTASGQITGEDYENVIIPLVNEKISQHDNNHQGVLRLVIG